MNAYISKSKQANWDDVLMARSWVKKKEFTILEWDGNPSNYNPKLPAEADILVIVPPDKPIVDKSVHIGKGQYSELVTYQKAMTAAEKPLVIKVIKGEDVFDVKTITETGTNWQTDFAKLSI